MELVWVKIRVEEECFWVNLREENRCLNPRWQCLKPRWQNSKWLPSSIWVKMNEFESYWTSLIQNFVQNGWIQYGRIQDGCHQGVQWQWMSLSQIELVWVRVLCKMAESSIAEFKMASIIKLSQKEWVWVRLNYFESEFCAKWLNPALQNSRCLPSSSWVRKTEFKSDWTSLSQSFVQNGWIQDNRIQDGCHHEVEWKWMSLSQNELVWVRVLCKMAE